MENFKFKKGDRVKIEKITDEQFNGIHPNGIDTGYYEYGVLQEDVEIGESCLVVDHFRFLHTSVVTEILSEDTFRTKNSIYKLSTKSIMRRESVKGGIAESDAEELLGEIDNMSKT